MMDIERRRVPRVSEGVVDRLVNNLNLEVEFENPPKVTLSLLSQAPHGKPPVGERDIVTTTAYQCYAPGITKMRSRGDEKAIKVANSTLEAGHHTTRMHPYYTFLI